MRSLSVASEISGRTKRSMLGEIFRLRRSAQLFGVSDYFGFRLYDDLPFGGHKEDFAGWRMVRWLDEQLNGEMWRGIVEDKIVFHSICSTEGLPLPRVLAIYHTGGRRFQGARTIRDHGSMAQFLRNDIEYPFFAKPSHALSGGGAAAVNALDARADELCLEDGTRIGVQAFVERLDVRSVGVSPALGWLFQERLRQHPEIVRLCGTTVATLRIVVLLGDEGPTIFRVVWRIPAAPNMTDNFGDGGRTGNLAAGLDESTGEILRVVRRVDAAQTTHVEHPDTGARLVGIRLPLYAEARKLVLTASALFPMFRFQHWDIALTEDGPLVVECNSPGGTELPQVATGRGIFDETMRAFVRKHGRQPFGKRA